MFAAFASQTRRARPSRREAGSILALLIIVVLVAAPSAQQMQTAFNAAPLPAANEAMASPTDISLLVGRSTMLNVGSVIAHVSLTVPDVADAMVTSASQILIHGKQPGTISLFVWDRGGAIKTYEVGPPRPERARTARAAVPRREHHGARQRQGRRAVWHRVEPVRLKRLPKSPPATSTRRRTWSTC